MQKPVTAVRLPIPLRTAIDSYCKQFGLTRTELLRLAVDHFLNHVKAGKLANKTLADLERQKLDMGAVALEALSTYLWENQQTIESLTLHAEKPSEKDKKEAQALEAREPSESEKIVRELAGEG